jgi:hypothetical protein
MKWHINIMGPSESAKGKRGGQQEESSNHILYQCPALVMCRREIFRSPQLLTDIRWASTRIVLVLAL